MKFQDNRLSNLSRSKCWLLIALAIVLWISSLHADTTWVAGEVYGTWTREGNPYLVTDTLIVPLDSTLNIQPGVEIWFLDQEIRRTPIYVYGNLRAIGAEGDSVYFYSPVRGFGGIDNRSTSDTEIRLEYCVIDSSYGMILSYYGRVVAKHSRIHSYIISIQTFHQVDTVQYCDLFGYGVRFYFGGPSVFQHNHGGGLNTYQEQMAPILGNHVNHIELSDSPWTEVYENHMENGQLYSTDGFCHDNYVDDLFRTWYSTFTFENNTVGRIETHYNQGTISRNRILGTMYGTVNISNGDFVFEKNLVTTTGTGITISNGGIRQILGNTIIFGERGISTISATGSNLVRDNIFIGDGVNCTGIYGSAGAQLDIRYNDFYQVNSVTYQCELDTGNILLDPRFRAGNPYDYQLQANSPCIDSGDPASPRDPDSTRSDMGCYFFDHRIDNPPAIISPVVVNVQRGTTLRYVARATDDFGPLRFGFWNLPGWLHRLEEQIDFEDTTAVVSGTVPQSQGDFSFGVWAEDRRAQRDSQEVTVRISPYTILAGEVTGVLTRERSPYMVVEDLVVPAGDSLRIESGVDIRFQWEPIEDLRHRIVVRGKLNAVGTPEDTIHFLPEFGDSLEWAWRGIQCTGPSSDTSRIRFASFTGGYYAVVADSSAATNIDHVRVSTTRYAIRVKNGAFTGANSCEFYQNNYSIFADGALATVTNCLSQDGTHFDFQHGSIGIVEKCIFADGEYGRAEYNSELQFIRNRIVNTNSGVYYINGASGRMANNIFSGGDAAGIYSADTVLISNNLFFDTNRGVEFSNLPVEVSLRNNLFLSNEIGIQMHYSHPPFEHISYNDLYGNDSDFVNCLPDSTNLYLDPMVQDTINFRLSLGSPCINAGDPDPFFNDVDSTRNDIGCWGGPWGESYPYVPVLPHQPKYIPNEFALLPPYPNPFNSVLIIPFTIPIEKEVIITIYNILGQKVQEFTFPPLSPGVHRVVLNSGSCSSGLYIIQLISGGKEFNQKALLLK